MTEWRRQAAQLRSDPPCPPAPPPSSSLRLLTLLSRPSRLVGGFRCHSSIDWRSGMSTPSDWSRDCCSCGQRGGNSSCCSPLAVCRRCAVCREGKAARAGGRDERAACSCQCRCMRRKTATTMGASGGSRAVSCGQSAAVSPPPAPASFLRCTAVLCSMAAHLIILLLFFCTAVAAVALHVHVHVHVRVALRA